MNSELGNEVSSPTAPFVDVLTKTAHRLPCWSHRGFQFTMSPTINRCSTDRATRGHLRIELLHMEGQAKRCVVLIVNDFGQTRHRRRLIAIIIGVL